MHEEQQLVKGQVYILSPCLLPHTYEGTVQGTSNAIDVSLEGEVVVGVCQNGTGIS
jgi:hypothetical protein